MLKGLVWNEGVVTMTAFTPAEEWAKDQWIDSALGDKRRNKRIMKLASDMIKHPEESIPTQNNGAWSGTKGAYRFLDTSAITHENLQQEHWKNTQVAVANVEKDTVLYIQDKTELDYSNLKQTKGLGYIGNHKGRGIMVQSILAVAYDKTPSIMGLSYQKAWARETKSRKKSETRCQRLKRATEADYWTDCLNTIERPHNSNQRHVAVGDRENDIYKFIKCCAEKNWNFLIRATGTRAILSSDGEKIILSKFARKLKSQGAKEIELRARDGKPARKVLLHIGWEKIKIIPPHNGFSKSEYQEIDIWCLRVWEDAPDGLEWILLTNLPIENLDDAYEKIQWYQLRWIIEEYHKCLKTGCSIERSQLQSAKRLFNLLGVLGILATKLLEMKYLVREQPDVPAKEHIPTLQLTMLCSYFKLSPQDITNRQFWHKVAGLGGFLGRKSDGEPGWQTLWRGWMRLLDMLDGAKTVMSLTT